MVRAIILCSRSARRESQTDLRGDRQAARDGREKEGGAGAGSRRRIHRETHSA